MIHQTNDRVTKIKIILFYIFLKRTWIKFYYLVFNKMLTL